MIVTLNHPENDLLRASNRESDRLIREAAMRGLRHSGYRALAKVRCDVTDGVVCLSGAVPTFFVKQIAQTIVLRLGGLKQLANQLEVESCRVESNSCDEYERLAS
jgi:osmotically-inducible protein OsmY